MINRSDITTDLAGIPVRFVYRKYSNPRTITGKLTMDRPGYRDDRSPILSIGIANKVVSGKIFNERYGYPYTYYMFHNNETSIDDNTSDVVLTLGKSQIQVKGTW